MSASRSIRAELVLRRLAPPGESEYRRCKVLALVRREDDGTLTWMDLRVLDPDGELMVLTRRERRLAEIQVEEELKKQEE